MVVCGGVIVIQRYGGPCRQTSVVEVENGGNWFYWQRSDGRGGGKDGLCNSLETLSERSSHAYA